MMTIFIAQRRCVRVFIPVLLLLLFSMPSARAESAKNAVDNGSLPVAFESSADEVCQDVAMNAKRTLWGGVRESADELFCRKSWVPGKIDELAACGSSHLVLAFGNKVKNKWNEFFDNAGAEWATLGPRGISVDWEEGTISAGIRRTFFGPALAYNHSTVEVVKEGGQAEGHITVCELDYDSNVVSARRQIIPNGQGNENEPLTFDYENKDNRILGVVIDTPLSVYNLEYRARLTNTAIRNSIGPVTGIADLHVHQLANLAFAGRLHWGQHAGDKATALAEEVINGPDSLKLTAEEVIESVTGLGFDANVIMKAIVPDESDEGFFQTGGGGYPNFDQWPHHADRSHQQVHISWLKEAHERHRDSGSNLNLLVVSVVNNDILCAVLKFVDPWGNVPIRDSQGKITWESANWGCTDHDNVLRQLEAIHQLENEYPWYRVAMTPWHARQIIADGDLAVVVSLETDRPLSGAGGSYDGLIDLLVSLALDTSQAGEIGGNIDLLNQLDWYGDWLDQLDWYRAMGVTTMQVVHESNSRFCGAAPHRNMMELLQLIHWPSQTWNELIAELATDGSAFDLDGESYNKLGLTPDGEELIDGLVKRNMPIDLAHGSQRCRKDIMGRVPQGYGLYDSHTKFKRLLEPGSGKDYGTRVLDREKEFLIMESIVSDYIEHKVLVGLRPASVDVYDAPESQVPNNCPGSANSFAQLVQYADALGLEFAFGTDFNSGVSQLGPRFNGLGREGACWADLVLDDAADSPKRPVKTDEEKNALPKRALLVSEIDGTNYYVDGMANIGWLPELAEDLITLTPAAERLRDSAEAYLTMWEGAYDHEPQAATSNEVEPGSVGLGLACTADDQCTSGRCTGIAGASGTCVCNEDADCGDGKFCNMGVDLKPNACEPLKANNESCAAIDGGRTCASGYCSFLRCYEPNSVPMGGTCYVDDACQQGKCSSIDGTKGTCVCNEDSDCGSGFWCNAGVDLVKNSCKPKLNEGEVCGSAGEFGVGHRCKSGSCKVSGIFSTKLTCQ